MRQPPKHVMFVAQTHWVVGLIIGASILILHLMTRNLPGIEFRPRTYVITGLLGGLYFVAGTLVWFGLPFGRVLSRICGLLYLPRPQFGGRIWDTMNSPEYQAHFTRFRRPKSRPASNEDREASKR
jgi:hypothetical protein